jgi:hypothetical protein
MGKKFGDYIGLAAFEVLERIVHFPVVQWIAGCHGRKECFVLDMLSKQSKGKKRNQNLNKRLALDTRAY